MLTGGFKTIDGFQPSSRIVMGTFPFASAVPYDLSWKLLDKYYELGGRTIDTARSYNGEYKNGDSKSEWIIGKWIKGNNIRKEITLITKGCYPELRDMHYSRMSPDCVRYDINTSLAVMDVDCVDMWMFHRDDEKIPVGEIVDAASEIVTDGLAKAIGVSNWTTKRIAEANEYARKNGKIEFAASEVQWNMAEFTRKMHRDDTMVAMYPEDYDWYKESRMPVFAYSSQAVGFFSKYPIVGLSGLNPRTRFFVSDVNIQRCELVQKICKEIGCSPAALCVAYIANNDVDGYAVIGNSKMEQLEDTMKAMNLVLDKEIIREIDNIKSE